MKRVLHFFAFTFLLVLALAAAASTQGRAQRTGLRQALELWQARHGGHWDIVPDELTGQARMLLGGQAFLYLPQSEVEEFQLARDFIEEAFGLFAVEGSSLLDDRILTLPFAALGTTDKRTVRFVQAIGGVPILGRSVNLLFEQGTGKLLAIDSSAAPNVPLVTSTPVLTSEDARTLALQVFGMATNGTLEYLGEPALVFLPLGDRQPRLVLAWSVDVSGLGHEGADVSYRYSLDAQDGSLLQAESRLLEAAPQQRARVFAHATEGGAGCCAPGHCCWLHDCTSNLLPCAASEPEPQPHLTVGFGSGHTVTTDARGTFARPPGASPDAELRFRGPFVEVRDVLASSDVVVRATLSGSPSALQLIAMNPAPSERDVAQANAFLRINQVRDWVRRVNPQDATADSSSSSASIPYRVVVNGPAFQGACNANYGAGRIKFYVGNAACPNGAFAPILWHEMGHWLTERYGVPFVSSPATGAFVEGAADVFSMYQMDYEQLYFLGSNLRSGLNVEPTCGDCLSQQGCYPNTHEGGLPLMGAFWKLRTSLKAANPASGGALADALFLGWQNAFDQDRIHSLVGSSRVDLQACKLEYSIVSPK